MTKKDRQAIEAMKTVKSYCDNFEICENQCIFYRPDIEYKCKVNAPILWIEPPVWSDTDIALAKALMSFGVDELYCPIHPQRSLYMRSSNRSDMGELKMDAFQSILPGETVKLSKIVKEQA